MPKNPAHRKPASGRGRPILLRPSTAVRERIEKSAETDRRSLNQESLVLIEEALQARAEKDAANHRAES